MRTLVAAKPLWNVGWRAAAFVSSVVALASWLAFQPRTPAVSSTEPVSPATSVSHEPAALIAMNAPALSSERVSAETSDALAFQLLARRFNDGANAELSQLANAIARLGGTKALELLRRAAHSRRPAARSAAFEALATLDTNEVRDFMLQELRGPEPIEAANYFSDSVEPRAVPLLEHLARTGAADLRTAAITALFAQGASAGAAVERLVQDDPEISDAVLGASEPPVALFAALRHGCISRLRAGGTITGPVFDFLARDVSAEGREALLLAAHDSAAVDSAVRALSARGDPASVATLKRLAKDADAEIADHAACALISSPDSRSHDELVRQIQGKLQQQAAAALERIAAPEAESAQRAWQRGENDRVRDHAARLGT